MSPAAAPSESEDLDRSLMRWLRAGLLLLVLLVAAFPAYRAFEGNRRADALARRRAAEIAMGRPLWNANCASCHGDRGEGPDAPALNSKEFFEAASEQLIHHVIQAGVPGSGMNAWWNEFGGSLTDEQIRAIVTYVLSWSSTAPSRPDWRNPSLSASKSD